MTYYVHKDAARDCLSEIKRRGRIRRYERELRWRKRWPNVFCLGLKPHQWKWDADGNENCFICDWVKVGKKK